MARHRVANPLKYVDEVGPKVRARRKEFVYQKGELFKEAPMAGVMKMEDVGGSARPTGKVVTAGPQVQLAPIPLVTAPLGQPAPPPRQAVVQRFMNPATASTPEEDALMQELEEELSPAPSPEPPLGEQDTDVETILKRFKGSPEEIARQVAKSYAASEKRMRQVEAEKNLLLKGQPAPAAPPPTQPLVANVPIMPQIQVNPFDYKKVGDTLLDKPAEHLQAFDEHISSKAQKLVAEAFTPLYVELLQNRLFRKFPEIVTEENIDVIKAMAMGGEGATDWDKLTNAVKKYTEGTKHGVQTVHDDEVERMKLAAQQPAAQAKPASGGKRWKLSELRKIMARPDYTRDPKWRKLVDKAYAEGRVLRDE